MRTELEILAGELRTFDGADLISARTITGHLKTATFIGLVSRDRPFFVPLLERTSIAACLRRHGFTEWDFERMPNGVPMRHGPFKL